MRIENLDERHFYEIEAARNDWSLTEFKRQFDTSLYERLALSRDKEGVKKLSTHGQVIEEPSDLIKDPYVLEFLGLPELGKGFTFVGRQVRLTFDEEHFRCDLVFYNRLLKCFVLFDLKIGELKHQDIGQMQMYVNYYDRKVKLPEDNTQIFASKYQTVLPSKEELQRLLNITD